MNSSIEALQQRLEQVEEQNHELTRDLEAERHHRRAVERDRYRWQKQAQEWGEECESVSAMLQAAGEDAVEIKQEHAALAAHVERLRQLWPPLSADISALFDQQPQNHSDGSYLVDGQSACEFAKALNDSPSISLARRDARIKAEAATEMSLRRPPGSVQRSWMQEVANEYRQQAEGGGDE
ncbi:hypothetical protein KUW00_19620 [Halomonas sp. DP5N14-9]|uniref:hypothetical protein n=1 Tax=Halomonas sp. DP5N14-9 TaxID=2859075 RepID=UPI001C990A58|nr:hypothetical protein [Halomonas sp. DP5N14-9]MBY5943088.1 hypothetical protein [Halomonas sp. DP5N14-9]